MKTILGLSTVTAIQLTFSTALALVPMSAWAEQQAVNKLYDEVLAMEAQAQEDLRQIREMKSALEEQSIATAKQERERLLEEQQSRELREDVKAREARMWSQSEKYRKLIKTYLSKVWYPPASSKKQTSAWLEVTLLPNGDLASATIVSSSGNAEYDRSVREAAETIRRYPVPTAADTFQRYFQLITIEFNPERLRWM